MNCFNFQVTPVLTHSSDNAICTLLNLDGMTMLFDCGWNETFTDEIPKILSEKLNFKIDYIFLSSNTLNHIGALPFLMKSEFFKEAKVYATTPIAKLGLNILIDAYIAKLEQSDQFNYFSDLDISSAFLSINEIKFKENIKLTNQDWEMVISPLPTGESLGSSLWQINYKLKTIVYAPTFSIKSKFVCDSFPYENLKNVNIFITDSKVSNKMPLLQNVIDKEFKKRMLDDMEKGRNIFIPSDTANFSLEILIRLERILDEFYSQRKQNDKLNYKVLMCSFTSHEVVESIKSLIVFYGTAYLQQTYNDSPLSLQHVKCIKDLKEYYEVKKNHNVIVLSSFQSVETGLSYKLLPEVVSDPNFRIFCTNKSHKSSLIRRLLKKVKEGIKIFEYEEIKRIPINTVSEKPNEKKEEHVEESNVNLNVVHKPDLSFKKKLFAKSPFPMFAYHQKQKLNEYGVELSEKEIQLMKSVSEDKAENFESSFKTFLYANDQNTEASANEMRLKVKRQDLFSKATYERKKKNVSLQAKFSFYDLFDSNGIDAMTKENVLREIHPKDFVLFLDDSGEEMRKIVNKLATKDKIKSKVVKRGETESFITKDNLLKIKYDNSILNSLPSFLVKDYGYVYDLKSAFLKIKTKRSEIEEISITSPNEEEKVDSSRVVCLNSNENSLETFYTTNDFKLINLKREIAKFINEEIFICRNFITNSKGDFKLSIDKKDLVLEGNLNPTYLKLRKCIYNNLIKIDEI